MVSSSVQAPAVMSRAEPQARVSAKVAASMSAYAAVDSETAPPKVAALGVAAAMVTVGIVSGIEDAPAVMARSLVAIVEVLALIMTAPAVCLLPMTISGIALPILRVRFAPAIAATSAVFRRSVAGQAQNRHRADDPQNSHSSNHVRTPQIESTQGRDPCGHIVYMCILYTNRYLMQENLCRPALTHSVML